MRIDEEGVGARYAQWFVGGLRGAGMRFLFSRRGLWILNTPYRRLLQAAGITAADRVLDLGCGLAAMLVALCEGIRFVVPPVGVDISPQIVELARAEARRAGLSERVELTVAAATSLPFPDQRFDVVFSSHMVKHLDDRNLALAFDEVARVLRPEGRFLLWEFAPSPWSWPLFWSARTFGLPPRFRLRSVPALSEALLRAGFARADPVRAGVFLVPPVPRLALLAANGAPQAFGSGRR